MAEEELGIRGKREPLKLTTPYITKTDAYTPGFFSTHLFYAPRPPYFTSEGMVPFYLILFLSSSLSWYQVEPLQFTLLRLILQLLPSSQSNNLKEQWLVLCPQLCLSGYIHAAAGCMQPARKTWVRAEKSRHTQLLRFHVTSSRPHQSTSFCYCFVIVIDFYQQKLHTEFNTFFNQLIKTDHKGVFWKVLALPVVHIEGSLGQVAVSTCYSPRRAISAVHAVQVQGPHEVSEF